MFRKWLSVIVLLTLLTSLFVSFPVQSADTKGDNVTYGLNSYEKGQEIIELRTETSKTTYLGNGKYQFQTGGAISHWKYDYKDGKEQWKETDLTFKDGRITEAPFTLEVNGLEVTMTSRKTGTIQTLTLDKIDGLTSVKASEWVYSNNTATWKDAALDTDVVLEVLPEGFRYKRILKSDKALLEAEYLQSKSVGTKDDIVLRVSARDADGIEVDVAKTVTASKIIESVDKTKDLSKIKYPIEIDPSPLIVGTSKDNAIYQAAATTNYGTITTIRVKDRTSNTIRSILETDISGIPAGQTLTSATRGLYYYGYSDGDPVGKTLLVYKLTRTDWVEIESTWNIYKADNNWSSAGGDYDSDGTPAAGSAIVPASAAWMSWDILAICQDAYTNGVAVEELIRCETEGLSSGYSETKFWSKEYSNAAYRPVLTIEYEAASSAPTVVTNPTINIEETTATASGNITATSANTTEQYFQFGTATGTYTDNVTTTENLGVGEMQFSLTGLTPGELYFGRAGAKIDGDIGWGDEVTWIQKPEPVTDFHSSDNGTSWIFLEWTNGSGMDLVGIRYDTGSAPSDNETGTQGYWGSDSSANITGLSDNTTYFFRVDTYATEGGLWSKADGDVTCSDTTDLLSSPTVITNAATLVEETTATMNGEITDYGNEYCTRGFEWGTATGVYGDSWSESPFGNGVYSYGASSLTKGEAYYYIATANNTAGDGSGVEQKFLTKPDLPTGINLTPGAGEIFIEWNPADGADKYMVRGSTSGYPANY
ncbi:MAG: DNRLRE domain-containing protein, partial [Burkholderiales bacterium]